MQRICEPNIVPTTHIKWYWKASRRGRYTLTRYDVYQSYQVMGTSTSLLYTIMTAIPYSTSQSGQGKTDKLCMHTRKQSDIFINKAFARSKK